MDCLFYDITSTYFEGTKCIIARLGYSRDSKPDKLQVNIGLVVTKEERFPVFHLVFEGNETDITTVGRALSRLKKVFSITDCLLIFDRGMVSEDNIGELDGSEYDFICGLKKKKVVKAVLREVEVAELSNEQNFVKDLEEGRITIDFERRNDKIADAEMLDGKYALMSTRIINFSWILYGRSIKPLAMHLGLKMPIYGYP